MALRSALLSATALLGVVAIGSTGGLDAVLGLPSRMIAPAYDTVTAASMHHLVLALTSYALEPGGLDAVTVDALADWGWTPGTRTAVTIWVAGDEFRVVAQDVGVGATQLEYTATDDPATSSGLVASPTQPVEPPSAATVEIVVVGDL